MDRSGGVSVSGGISLPRFCCRRCGIWLAAAVTCCLPRLVAAQVAIRGDTVCTMSGELIQDGMVLIVDGKIVSVGRAADISVPDGFDVLSGVVVTPGLIDAHSVVGLSGIFNVATDQDQLESSSPIQPELRAVDAYNADEALLEWIRGFGVTTIHTGHAPGELISGQTMIVKTSGSTVGQAVLKDSCAIAVTLSSAELKADGKSPGTRGKSVSLLRAELIRAREYAAKLARAGTREPGADAAEGEDRAVEPPARDLRLETLNRALERELAFMVTAERSQDIFSALRLAEEFQLRLWLDGAAEAYLALDEIKAAGVPVLVHATMARPVEARENLSFETASRLRAAGIPFALQSGYEPYVPKTRVVLFEAGMAAANGLTFEQALASITSDAAQILGVSDRVGSLAHGRDGDVAVFDGDPFEYTTHCTAVVINGRIVSRDPH